MVKRRTCKHKGCRKPARSKVQHECHRCVKKHWRKRNPERAAYNNLKASARRRGVVFAISFSEFMLVALISEYVTGRGNERGSLTVDRIDNRLGYLPGNLQVLTREENSVKQAKYDQRRMESGYAWRR